MAIILLFPLVLSSQKGIELGGWLGTSYYFGDLKTEFKFDEPSLAGGLNFRYNFNERLCAKASLNYARIHADDANSTNTFERNRNLSFRSNIFDFSIQGEFNFLTYIHGSEEYFFTPYLFAGLSAFTFSPKASYENNNFNLRLMGTEGQPLGGEYGRFSFAVNYGFGVKWDLNVDWSLNVHLSIYNSASDYIDDVSDVFPDLDELNQLRGETAVALSNRALVDGIGEAGRQRGNNKNNDMYILFGVSIMKYFGQLNCPKIVNK